MSPELNADSIAESIANRVLHHLPICMTAVTSRGNEAWIDARPSREGDQRIIRKIEITVRLLP